MDPRRLARFATPLLCLALGSGMLHAAAPSGTPARLTQLEDREAIRLVLRDYGLLLDQRRFDEFGQLFAATGEYVSAGRTTRGPKEIAEGLRAVMAGNSLGLAEPNFHVLFNEQINLDGDNAQATSQSFFVAPGADGAPQIVMMASYEDALVRTPAGWRFARRVVSGNMGLRAPPRAPQVSDRAQPPPPATASASAPAPAPIAGVVAPNVVVISPTLVTSGQPTRESLLRLKAEGYTAVISLAPGNTADAVPDQAEILRAQGIEFVHIPIPWQAPEAKHLQATAAALDRLKGRKVLVHCQMNMRASAVTFLYRTVYAKEDPATAWLDVKKLWTPKDQWANFIKQQLRAGSIAFKPE